MYHRAARQRYGVGESVRIGYGSAIAIAWTGGLLFCGWLSPVAAQTRAVGRIVAPIRSNQMQVVHGSVPPLTAHAEDQGQLRGSTVVSGMSLVFRRSTAQQADLAKLLQAQQTKGSPLYHQWLQPGQFAARYGASPSDIGKVAAWLQSQGFRIDSIPASADRIDFSGTAAQVNAAYRTELHRYLLHGQAQWANSTDISVPQAIAGITLGVIHLNTFRPLPHVTRRFVHGSVQGATAGLTPHFTVQDQNGNELNFIAPEDSATLYNVTGLYSRGITGQGQTIGIAGQTDITQYRKDIANFRSLSGLNASNLPTQVLVPNSGSNQVYPGDLEEADIDVEWSGAIAKDASIVYITVGNNQNMSVFDALTYAIQNPLQNNNTQFLPVLSISYGACEQAYSGSGEVAALEQALQQANAQGQTIIASSGDTGSADCEVTPNPGQTASAASHGLAVDYPASSQYVTGAGGTSFSGDVGNPSKYWNSTNDANNGSALSYIPETTWNDSATLTALANSGSLSSSGGGASTLFAKPSWQVGPGVPGDNKRDVPDISLAADPVHDGYVLCTEETNSGGTAFTGTPSCAYPLNSNEVPYFDATNTGSLYGGTSIVAPQLAGMITLWNQEAGNSGVGNANPVFYLAAQNSTGAFHDVLTGSNAVVCQQGSPDCVPSGSGNYAMSCCAAGSGYDLATGLGSVDASALGAVWPGVRATNSNFSLLSNPGAVSVNPGGSTSTTLVLTPSNGFSGAVTLACSGLPANTSCSFSPAASVNLSSGSAQNVTLTLSATSSAHLVTPTPFAPEWPMQAALAGALGLSLFGTIRKRRVFRSGWMAMLLLATGLIAAGALSACGSATPGGAGTTPAQKTSTTTVTVTGTSGSSTASAQVQLTVT